MFAAIAMRHRVANDPASLAGFFRWFLLLGVVVSTFGLLSYQFGAAVDPRWETAAENMKDVTQRSGIAVNAVVSTLGNRSNMGAFAVLILLMAAATRHVSFRKHWHLTAAASAVVGLALALTFSRTAYVGLAVGGLALFVAEKRPNIKILITVIVLGAAIIPLVDAVSPGSLEAALGSMGDSTISGRSAVWNEVASNLTDHPFGVGLGVYGNALRGFGQDARSGGLGAVDNSFLLIAVEQGLQSAAFWVVLFLAIGVRAFLNLRTARSMLGVAMARMVWAWYWAFIAMSITIDWFHALPVICPLWFFFGLQFALPALERTWESNALAYQSYAAARQARSLADRVKRSLGLCPLETARSGYGRVDVP
jgi:O-antigen ligase